jgi:hypothetical protein
MEIGCLVAWPWLPSKIPWQKGNPSEQNMKLKHKPKIKSNKIVITIWPASFISDFALFVFAFRGGGVTKQEAVKINPLPHPEKKKIIYILYALLFLVIK